MNRAPALVVRIGVSGSGKSTLAALLADSLGLNFLEADDFHSESNKARMSVGIPLSDGDREPWMNAVGGKLADLAARGDSCVLAHSALRRAHRDRLRRQGFRTLFLHLDGDRELIASRMALDNQAVDPGPFRSEGEWRSKFGLHRRKRFRNVVAH